MNRYTNIKTSDLKDRISEIEEILHNPSDDLEANALIEQDLNELKDVLKERENKMIKVIIVENKETGKFEATDKDGTVYHATKKLPDLKTSLKRSKKGDFEIVEKFEEVKVEKPKKEKAPKKPVADKKTTKKAKGYEDYKEYIIANFTDGDLYSKSPLIAKFCKKFDLALTKAGRNLTFEKVLDKMTDEGIVDYVPTAGKYKKLEWYYTEDHVAAMNPDEEL